ncbi:MAG: DEDD exonuclease domain-containing protein [Propioniciclava sp.]
MTTSAAQPTLLDLGEPLRDTTFVVVDLETTGSGPEAAITEIGAVRVRGGEVVGEFATLVNPGSGVPPQITILTGITTAMVVDAPSIAIVLPSFLEFARGATLVAHNARFDVGFLRRAAAALETPWPAPSVVDTLGLARGVLLRDEVPNLKLATLAHHFGSPVSPNHRALADAQATVHVLHGLVERVGNLGVNTLADLLEFTRGVSPQRRAKRTLGHDLPRAPGVYSFVADLPDRDGRNHRQVLYVGKSVNIRNRVRSYFTASEKRRRMEEMVRIATAVEATPCRTLLEAEVLELRLIAAHTPCYNRRSKFPTRQHWLKLTIEPFPRLSIVRRVTDDGADYLGPFSRREIAEETRHALYDAFPIRQCTPPLSEQRPISPCILRDLGQCVAPCDGSINRVDYSHHIEGVRMALTTDVRHVLGASRERLRQLVEHHRFEEAGQITHRLTCYLTTAIRWHRIRSLAGCPQIVAARAVTSGWEIHVIRYGRLASATLALPGEVVPAVARDAVVVAEHVEAPTPGLPAASTEETERIASWLEQPGIRLIDIDGDWAWPLHGAISPDALSRHALGDPTMAEVNPGVPGTPDWARS